MPIYEFVCADCKQKFDVLATLEQKEKGLKLKCSNCGSSNAIQVFSNVMFNSGSTKSSNPPCGSDEGPSCCG